MGESLNTLQLRILVERARQGDGSALEQLILRPCPRMRKLAHNMLLGDRVHEKVGTDDVVQTATIRFMNALRTALADTTSGGLTSTKHYYALAALKVRQVMVDLARQNFGRDGNRPSEVPLPEASCDNGSFEVVDRKQLPEHVQRCLEVHEAIERLSDDERHLAEAIVCESTLKEAYQELGYSTRTGERVWARVRLHLYEQLRVD